MTARSRTPRVRRPGPHPIVGLHRCGSGEFYGFEALGFWPGGRKTLIIGRDAGCDLRILGAGGVSGRHAALAWVEGKLVVEDLHSTNGTMVNNVAITERMVLDAGFYLTLGTVELVCVGLDGRIPLVAHTASSLIHAAGRMYGSSREAAERIGVPRETFRRKLKRGRPPR